MSCVTGFSAGFERRLWELERRAIRRMRGPVGGSQLPVLGSQFPVLGSRSVARGGGLDWRMRQAGEREEREEGSSVESEVGRG